MNAFRRAVAIFAAVMLMLCTRCFPVYAEEESWIKLELDFVTGNTYTLNGNFRWDGTTVGEEKFTYDVEANESTGILMIENLDWGEYKLVETVAEGYILPKEEESRSYPFTIEQIHISHGGVSAARNACRRLFCVCISRSSRMKNSSSRILSICKPPMGMLSRFLSFLRSGEVCEISKVACASSKNRRKSAVC